MHGKHKWGLLDVVFSCCIITAFFLHTIKFYSNEKFVNLRSSMQFVWPNIIWWFCKSLIVFAEKENLCLYGLPNETWEVNLPAEEVPPELPEPALGINFARDGMDERDWLSLVAVHSDAWLLAVAFYFGARFGFDKESRYFNIFLLLCWFITLRSYHQEHVWSICLSLKLQFLDVYLVFAKMCL